MSDLPSRGDEWIVMGICYSDEYQRVDGEWLFAAAS
jgi:hypothetical protein